MAVSIKGDSADPMVEPNVIPLVDIMLVLLIIFIITIPVMTHAVKIDLPRDTPPTNTVEPVIVRIYVEFDGTIYWNGTPIDQQTFRDYVAVENANQTTRSPRSTSTHTAACPTCTSRTCSSRCSGAGC
jgi:biopolymer transport protein ExbD